MHTRASPATEYHRTLITLDEGERNPSHVFHGYLVYGQERFFSLVNTNLPLRRLYARPIHMICRATAGTGWYFDRDILKRDLMIRQRQRQ